MAVEHDPPDFAEKARMAAAGLQNLSDRVAQLEAANVVLAVTLSQVIAHLSVHDDRPSHLVRSLTDAAGAFAESKQADPAAPPSHVDGAGETHRLLVKLSMAGAKTVEAKRQTERRWWRPSSWFRLST
jgi:hypothetical protein